MFNEDKFNSLARQGYNRIPVIKQLPADLDTPLSLYLKLANEPYSYLLESVVGGERFGRYSFIGLPARTVLRMPPSSWITRVGGQGRSGETSPQPHRW